jgi:SAM-dependent methyltransferase
MEIKRASAEDWDQIWFSMAEGMGKNPGRDFRNRLIVNSVREFFLEPKSILDVGCGTGDLLVKLAEEFPQSTLYGLEVSNVGVIKSKEKVPQGKIFKLHLDGNRPYVKDPIDSVDVIICSEVLEHLDDPKLTLEWIAGAFPSGTAAIFTVPGGPMSFLDRFIGHRQHFNRKRIHALFNAAQFAEIEIFRSGFPGMNLIRLGAILRGEKIIKDIQRVEDLGFLQRSGLRIADYLLTHSAKDSYLGWQLIVTAKIA